MSPMYQIDPQLDIPIYQQLVDEIRAGIKGKLLPLGQQLPTVQDMAKELSVAKGTIKRAYDELERQGLVEKIQGRGTYVCYQPSNSGSRKDQAMAAIDNLLDQLEQMGLTPGEINIFLNLKIRERAHELSQVKMAVVADEQEFLSQITEQLRRIKQVEMYCYTMDSIRRYPYKLEEELDLIVSTPEGADALTKMLPVKKKIARVALRLSAKSFSEVIRLPQGAVVGILSYSRGFGEQVAASFGEYAEDISLLPPEEFSPDMDMDGFLAGKHAVLVPEMFEKYCTDSVADRLNSFHGKLIPCQFKMDEGSFLYLEEKIRRILQDKKI